MGDPAPRLSNSDSGTRISRTSSVIAIAKTPSLNASVRPGAPVVVHQLGSGGLHSLIGFGNRMTRSRREVDTCRLSLG